MILNDKEKSEAKALATKHPVVNKMLQELVSYDIDPAKMFYREVVLTIQALSEDMESIRTGKVAGDIITEGEEAKSNLKIMADNKTFGMIKDLLINLDKIFAGLQKGKFDIDPNAALKNDEKDKQPAL